MIGGGLLTDARLLARAAASGRRRARAPFKLTVAVTWRCEQRCTHCRIWQRPSETELTAGEWRQVWRSGRTTLSWIDLTGGEPTRRADFAEIAVAAVDEVDALAMLHFPSNGRRPDVLEGVVAAIQGASPRRLVLSISLDGPRSVHDRLRGDPGAFDAALESFRRLRARGTEVYLGMTLSPWNVELLEPTVAAIADEVPGFGWRDLHVNFLHRSAHYFQNQDVERPDPVRLADAIRLLRARRGPPRHPTHLLEHLYLRHVPEHLRTGRSPVACGSMSGSGFIDPTGRVYPCHIWDAPVGELRDVDWSLPALWGAEAARTARAEVVADRCPGCWTPCEAYPAVLADLPAAVGRRANFPRVW